MKNNLITERLTEIGACSEAISLYGKYGDDFQLAWNECTRGDHMLWLLGKQSGAPESVGRKQLVLIACECARLALPYTKDPRVLACIETAEKWTRGEATINEVRAARRAADAADAAYAAAAAAYAADAAYAAYAAAAAAYAADAADAAYAAYAAARKKTLKQCADIVRKHVPNSPI